MLLLARDGGEGLRGVPPLGWWGELIVCTLLCETTYRVSVVAGVVAVGGVMVSAVEEGVVSVVTTVDSTRPIGAAPSIMFLALYSHFFYFALLPY